LSESTEKHRKASPDRIRVAVITISDTRTAEADTGGNIIVDSMQRAGHEVVYRGIVTDDAPHIRESLEKILTDASIDAIVTTGGTGISVRDTTYEVVSRMLDKKLDGFGELFRMLSYEEVGAAAILSRAIAGAVGSKFVACLPGSPNAVRLATEKLLVPEIRHIVFELRKHSRETR
jgi:molybdenum cofactor biosynthesis protein B